MIPYLKWAGGKRTISNAITNVFDASGCVGLVEPFCGALSISLRINAPRTVIADNNEHLINLHSHIQASPSLIHSVDFGSNQAGFLKIRDEFNELIRQGKHNTPRAASLFYTLNRTCFNGLCRFNKLNEFNVGWGKYKKPWLIDDFSDYSTQMTGWIIKRQGFEKTIIEALETDMLFVDPPYDKTYVGYTGEGFDFSAHERLAQLVNQSKAKAIITNSKTQRLVELYQSLGFEVYEHTMPRTISCNGRREPVKEIIAFKGFVKKEIEKARIELKDFRKLRLTQK